MKRFLAILTTGAALLVAGCGPMAVLEYGGPAEAVAILPAALETAAAAGDLHFVEARAGYSMSDIEHVPGFGSVSDAEESLITAGVVWHWTGPLTEPDEEMPSPLWSLEKLTSELSFDFSTGSMDIDGDESDVTAWRVKAEYVSPQEAFEGLGFSVVYGVKTIADVAGSSDDAEAETFTAEFVHRLRGIEGVVARIGYTKTDYEVGSADSGEEGLVGGARFYRELPNGKWIDGEFTYGFYDYRPGMYPDDAATEVALRITYYPLIELGVTLGWGTRDWDDNDDLDEDRLSLGVSYTIKALDGLDVGLDWSKTSYGDDENSTIALHANYRF